MAIQEFWAGVTIEYRSKMATHKTDLAQKAQRRPYVNKIGYVSPEQALESFQAADWWNGWANRRPSRIGIAARRGLAAAGKFIVNDLLFPNPLKPKYKKL